MGVLGLTPFLQKHCPDVIKVLPERLRSLSGKTIVIDGTLVTQRMHFAPMPHPNRHVLGWYRLITELNESGVKTICVFDGKERNLAKAVEVERRKELRRVSAVRGEMEAERLHRLQRLTRLLKQYQRLPDKERESASLALRALIARDDPFSLSSEKGAVANDGQYPDMLAYEDVSAAEFNQFSFFNEHPGGITREAYSIDALLAIANEWPQEDFKTIETEGEANTVDSTTAEKLLDGIHDNYDTQTASMEPEWLQENSTPIEAENEVYSSADKAPLDATDTTTHNCHASGGPVATIHGVSKDEDGISKTPDIKITEFGPSNDCEANADTTSKPLSQSEYSHTYKRAQKKEQARSDSGISDSHGDPDPSSADPLELHGSHQAEVELWTPVYASGELNIDWDAYAAALSHPDSSQDVSTKLAELYEAYRKARPALTTRNLLAIAPLPLDVEEPALIEEVTITERTPPGQLELDEVDPADVIVSRVQHHLTIEEGKFWGEIAKSMSNPDRDPVEVLLTLTEKSQYITQTYERRSKAPTTATYEQSRMILEAMGVPCIESSSPFEAEALAASLVINGLADYVASEDTDVLIYEAPLVRNITSRKSPLVTISGADVRKVLQLGRDSYVDFALLLGTDFSRRIKNVGPARALKFIRQYGCIERVVEHETQFTPRVPQAAYLEQVELARLIFHTLPPVPDKALLQPKESSASEVAQLLHTFGLSRALDASWDLEAPLAGNYFNDNPSADSSYKRTAF